MSTESELQAKYDAAVRDWETAKQAREAAKKEKDEKKELVNQQPDDSRERHLAEAESYKADIIWTEKYEQECAAECEKCEIAVELMVHRHGVNSKAAQIATHRLELARTKRMKWKDSTPYCTEWDKLIYKGWQLYYQLKAEECHAAADELEKAICEFENRIRYCESYGFVFYNAWDAANAALDKWENNDNRTDWDAAKPKYDAALKMWNAFKPKGDEYANALVRNMNKFNNNTPIAYFLHEHVQVLIQKLEDDNNQKTQEINKLKKGLEQKDKENGELKKELQQIRKEMCELKNDSEQHKEMCEVKGTMGGMAECMNALAQGIHTLLRGQCQYIAESEATARTAVEREWQLWCEHTMAERRTLQESEAAARHQYEQLYDFDE